MRIAVLGTGGVGGYFGGRLAAAGHDVTFLARGAHLDAIRRTGSSSRASLGDFTVQPAKATDDIASIGPVDVVLLAVKTWQLPPVLAALPTLIGPDTAVVTTQNGVEAPDQVAAAVGRAAVLPGIAKIFAYIDGPGRITHAGGPASLAFDEWSAAPGAASERVTRLREAIIGSGAVSPVPDDIWAELWSKMLFVVPFGGLGAALDATIGELRTAPSRAPAGRDAGGGDAGPGPRHTPARVRRRGHDGVRRRPARRRDDLAPARPARGPAVRARRLDRRGRAPRRRVRGGRAAAPAAARGADRSPSPRPAPVTPPRGGHNPVG